MKKIKKIIPYLFWLFIAAYAGLFLIEPHLGGPTDDVVFLKTLQSGKPLVYYSKNFPYYDSIINGRFQLLTSLEYNIVALFSASPFAYFSYHAIQFILFIIIFILTIRNTRFFYNGAYLLATYLISLPGFSFAWFILQLPERNVLFFALLFVFIFQYFLAKKTLPRLLALILIANICIYYKETAFLLIGGFAFARITLSWKTSDFFDRILDWCLLGSSMLYLILYALIVLPHTELGTLKGMPTDFLAVIKNYIDFATISDPLLFFGLLPLFVYRLITIVTKKEVFHTLYDALLIGASCFISGYLLLRLSNPNYLLPAYAFALPAISFFVPNIPKKIVATPLILIGSLWLFNSLPAGIHYLTYDKYLPINFNKTLDFISTKISTAQKKPISIFLDGMTGTDGALAIYTILPEFLEYRGFSNKDFDLKATFTRRTSHREYKFEQPYTVFKPGFERIQKGDLLLVTPQSWQQRSKNNSDELARDYTLLFQTRSPYLYPMINAKSIIKNYLATHSNVASLIKSPISLQLADYYVYEKN